MALLQHYFTSYKNERTGRAGWQTLAMSRDVTPELDRAIQGLIGYKAPQSLSSDDLASHPVALRYLYEPSRRSFLLCSQSTGLDNQNRPGNFFAHTLVIPPENFADFALCPPILYWKSPVWCREDRSQREELPGLALEELPTGPDVQESVWDFLALGKRRELLSRLFGALVQRKRQPRRLIILDTNEHVALWIASLSILLPPAYRSFLSFATYHHVPHEQRYLITGTTRDWWQRVPPQMQNQAFFVLDAEREIWNGGSEYSHYAQLVTSIQSSSAFEQQLAPLFAQYARYFPPQDEIDEQLEFFALYVGLFNRDSPSDLSEQEYHALTLALAALERSTERDGEELARLQTSLLRIANQQEPRLRKALERVQHLLTPGRLQLQALQPPALEAPRREARSRKLPFLWKNREEK